MRAPDDTATHVGNPTRETKMVQALPQIESRRLYRQIAELISGYIDSGHYPPGTLLPAERELAQQLGVSRASVREALIALEVEGRVSVKVGNGVTVLDAPRVDVDSASDSPEPPRAYWADVGPLELLDARILVESENAALAARHATAADIEELESHLTALAVEHRELHHDQPADRRFHLKIAEMTGNQAMVHMVATLLDQRDSPMFARFEDHFVTPRLFEDINQNHKRILDAIRDGDSTAARAAMKRHLRALKQEFTRALSSFSEEPSHDGATLAIDDSED
ncbi:GntR family transcriptional regulator, transcriptional repressor for pyruvate dehydrogenase complex [Pararobbsia alpina]|uniref:FadR/GntR family transcriptional regulator n=1 Tax=Pararobbsia alpina TaxID=621374 RepID=UPI0039A6558B